MLSLWQVSFQSSPLDSIWHQVLEYHEQDSCLGFLRLELGPVTYELWEPGAVTSHFFTTHMEMKTSSTRQDYWKTEWVNMYTMCSHYRGRPQTLYLGNDGSTLPQFHPKTFLNSGYWTSDLMDRKPFSGRQKDSPPSILH